MINKQGTNFIYTDERQRKLEKKRAKAEKKQAEQFYWNFQSERGDNYVIDRFILIIPNIGVISTHQNKVIYIFR